MNEADAQFPSVRKDATQERRDRVIAAGPHDQIENAQLRRAGVWEVTPHRGIADQPLFIADREDNRIAIRVGIAQVPPQ